MYTFPSGGNISKLIRIQYPYLSPSRRAHLDPGPSGRNKVNHVDAAASSSRDKSSRSCPQEVFLFELDSSISLMMSGNHIIH